MSVLLLSGGLDSAVLLAREVNEHRHLKCCVSFAYGQRHRRELDFAYQLAHYYGCRHMQINLDLAAFRGSALTGGGDVPHAHFKDPVQSATVVPNRNAVMLATAAVIAVKVSVNRVLFAAHAGDAAIYPDCRPDFVEAMAAAMQLACGVRVEAPFLFMAKRDIIQLGRQLQVPFDMTWSCYEGGAVPCGQCGACIERNEAMAE